MVIWITLATIAFCLLLIYSAAVTWFLKRVALEYKKYKAAHPPIKGETREWL